MSQRKLERMVSKIVEHKNSNKHEHNHSGEEDAFDNSQDKHGCDHENEIIK